MDRALNTLVEVQQQMVRLLEQQGRGSALKFRVMGENQDVEDYLTLFERHMVLHKVPEVEWTRRLAPVLTG